MTNHEGSQEQIYYPSSANLTALKQFDKRIAEINKSNKDLSKENSALVNENTRLHIAQETTQNAIPNQIVATDTPRPKPNEIVLVYDRAHRTTCAVRYKQVNDHKIILAPLPSRYGWGPIALYTDPKNITYHISIQWTRKSNPPPGMENALGGRIFPYRAGTRTFWDILLGRIKWLVVVGDAPDPEPEKPGGAFPLCFVAVMVWNSVRESRLVSRVTDGWKWFRRVVIGSGSGSGSGSGQLAGRESTTSGSSSTSVV